MYVVVSLIVWLILEMTGEVKEYKKDRAEVLLILIVFWLPILIVLPVIGVVTLLGRGISKLGEVKIW